MLTDAAVKPGRFLYTDTNISLCQQQDEAQGSVRGHTVINSVITVQYYEKGTSLPLLHTIVFFYVIR